MKFIFQAAAILASVVSALPAEQSPALNASSDAILAHGETYFTADGYYNTDCTGNKYWSYEVSEYSSIGCLNENSEIGSVWIHNYGSCADNQVHVGQYDVKDCVNGERIAGQFTSRGTCLRMINNGNGDRSVQLSCEPRP